MTSQEHSQMKLIVYRFNELKGRKFSTTGNENLYEPYVEIVNELGLKAIVDSIKEFDGDDIHQFFGSITNNEAEGNAVEKRIETEKVEDAKVVEKRVEPVKAETGLGMLERAIAGQISESILGNVEERCDAFIAKTYGVLPQILRIESNGVSKEIKGIVHEKFKQTLQFVSAQVPVFLSGPAGSGKNVICKQVAESLELDFYFSNAVTQEYKITGFTDANGRYQESQFYQAFKNGGLFFLDEMDASVPEVLIILNAAIANGYFDFPAPIGKIDAHDKFRIIAAGNTFGLGASIEYTGRNQLDAASLDRFAVIEIQYSRAIELAVTSNDIELVDFIRSFRSVCEKSGIQSIASYRALGNIHKMSPIVGLEEAIRTCLVKNLRKEDVRIISKDIECAEKYRKSLRALSA